MVLGLERRLVGELVTPGGGVLPPRLAGLRLGEIEAEADLNAQFQGWLQHYNTRRRNHGDFMRGRTPFAVMEAHLS